MDQNTAKERAYKKVKELFARYIDSANKGYNWAEEERMAYQGACAVYEEAFEEEFLLTPEDRHEILGVNEYECEDFIRDTFREKGCKGIETECFFNMAADAGLYKPGDYNSMMSKVLQKMTKVVSHHNDEGEFVYNTFELA